MNKLLIQYIELKDDKQRPIGEQSEYVFKNKLDDIEFSKFLCKIPIPKKVDGDLLALYTVLDYKKEKDLKGGMAISKETFDETKSAEGVVQLIFANGIVHQVKHTIEFLEGKKNKKK